VLLVDFSGSGGSSESYTTSEVHEAEDVAAALQCARQQLSHCEVCRFVLGAVPHMAPSLRKERRTQRCARIPAGDTLGDPPVRRQRVRSTAR
jgi:hypothetical protein